MPTTPTIREGRESDLPAIMAIYNDAVANTTAIWNDALVDLPDRERWFQTRTGGGFPVLVAEREGAVAGYASYGPFRPFDGYRFTAELSVYVDGRFRGEGIGNGLLQALMAAARARGVHVLVAGIEASNTASLNLHKRNGFVEVGRMPEVGFKFGRWLDLVLLQSVL
ncbi:GNAT family N-acetyltransferase [Chthonobacter albigriseus]|uniref:GNAT family N-acetyltransferase n=1 Tax=Chthonobacter albigriseus TaxID=1683161 RepID=UPI0015EE4150|nr:GNAT family N-acetyltransferase [Chthonobacter albigriseus]